MSFFTSVFSALGMGHSTRPQPTCRPRTRLTVECLEERTLLNNRFVVPVLADVDNVATFHTLRGALTAPGLDAGDVIQIQLGSSPGPIADADIDAALADSGGNLTIQGEPAASVSEIPSFRVTNAVTISQPNFILRNVQVELQGGGLTYLSGAAGPRILNSIVVSHFAVATDRGAIDIQSTGAVIANSTFASYGGDVASRVISLGAVAGSGHVISGNTISSPGSGMNQILLSQSFPLVAGPLGDQITHNTFLCDPDVVHAVALYGNTITFRGNTIRGTTRTGLAVGGASTNVHVIDNTITGTGVNTFGIDVGQSFGLTTSATIALNRISIIGGTGMILRYGSTASNIKIEGNDFHGGQIGVFLFGAGPLAGLDLGGGSLGSKGGNNFRGYAGASSLAAAIVSRITGTGTLSAQKNLFSVADPETAIYDQNDDATVPNVDASNPLTGNAAYVQTLYCDFLKTVGDTNNPADAGAWVAALNGGASPQSVANNIMRSNAGLGVIVDGLYRQFLQRGADATGRANFITRLKNGATLEAEIANMVGSAEYRVFFGSDAAYVQSLYLKLLGRTGSNAEVASHLGQIATVGRLGVANNFLTSLEYRRRVVRAYYVELLNRSPSLQAVDGWVNSGLDVLSIKVLFAASGEYQTNA